MCLHTVVVVTSAARTVSMLCARNNIVGSARRLEYMIAMQIVVNCLDVRIVIGD